MGKKQINFIKCTEDKLPSQQVMSILTEAGIHDSVAKDFVYNLSKCTGDSFREKCISAIMLESPKDHNKRGISPNIDITLQEFIDSLQSIGYDSIKVTATHKNGVVVEGELILK